MTTILIAGTVSGVALLSSTGSVLSAVPGTANTVMGAGAGAALTGGTSDNVIIGTNAAAAYTGNNITAIGEGAFQHLVGGSGGVAIGVEAAQAATSGTIFAIGGAALHTDTVCGTVLAIGDTALHSLNAVVNAFAIGDSALSNYVAGGSSPQHNYPPTVAGSNAGSALTSGALTGIGQSICNSLTTGEATAVGFYAGTTNASYVGWASITGVGNTFIGAFATVGDATTDPSYVTSLGYGTTCQASGGVAIGVDHTHTSAAATVQDQIMLGTSLHTVYTYQTNTSLGATYSNPSLTNSVVGAVINATKDTVLYLEVTTVFVGLVISMGPASTPTNAIFVSAACPVGTLITLRVPGGWYVATSYTSGAFHQAAVTC
jgi:hypothetical protein